MTKLLSMLKPLRIILLLLSCGVASVNCANGELRKKVVDFMQRKVLLPSELVEVKNGYIYPAEIALDSSTLILFYGKDECTSCAINHLMSDLFELNRLEQTGKCKVLILFSPSEDDMLDVQEQIRILKLSFPIYIDLYGDFYRINQNFPADRRFHTFLLGKDAHPVFVGNPLHGEKMSKAFERVLKK